MEVLPNIHLQFLGAAGTVTGSKHLLTLGNYKILIDCGLFQGKYEKELNCKTLPVDVQEIDCILLTHGHLDHCGYLPVLVRQGFKGHIFGTSPTLQIAGTILTDSAKIAEEEQKHSKKHPKHKHTKKENEPIEPWQYTMDEAEATIRYFKSKPLNEWINLFPEVKIRYCYNGHIIGACFIEILYEGKTIVFSGDIGRQEDFLLFPPQQPEKADMLIIESTYGNRLHPHDSEEQLARLINEAAEKKSTIIIPSFAVERMQLLVYLLWQMRAQGNIPNLPIYMDSPMGKNVLEVFIQNKEWHKLPPEEYAEMLGNIKLVRTIKETFDVIDYKQPKIVIAGSGMVTGGRVLTYLEYYIENPDTTILLSGYQAIGTNGRYLQEGAQELNIRGETYKVRATVKTIEGLSAHADQQELLQWMSKLQPMPAKIFLVHGEPDAALALKDKITEIYKVSPQIASMEM